MASLDSLVSIGVRVYQNNQDVPYVLGQSPEVPGGHGAVQYATRRTTGQPAGKDAYAIKKISAVSPQEQLSLANEIRLLKQFRHPNILGLEEAYTIDNEEYQMHNTVCLVTKPWATVSLQRFIGNIVRSSGTSTFCSWFKPQTLHPWPSIMRQCLSGLQYLHSQKPHPIRHGDIKPDNIVLFCDPKSSAVRPIIVDFGISMEHIDGDITSDTATYQDQGTYQYKTPEELAGQKLTLASDIFTLGCCFALIEGVLSPWPALEEVYSRALETGDCQFAHNTDSVNGFLETLLRQPPMGEDLALRRFRTGLRLLVRQMLQDNPD
ncbi:hypothetical protein NUW58_g1819 [Xylaria curta]|uniref:Uncharacterized protein n=1 Tax=Xylaria curta TaxID=42375 RepID=A0ACC1PIM3_9PEZI|nr:hypothetical protein NUW58_g1819 [Xylaria curta]